MSDEALLWTLAIVCAILLIAVVLLVWERIRLRHVRRALKPTRRRARPQDPMVVRERGFAEGYRSGVAESYQHGYKVGHRAGFLEGVDAHAKKMNERFGIPLEAHYPSAATGPSRSPGDPEQPPEDAGRPA